MREAIILEKDEFASLCAKVEKLEQAVTLQSLVLSHIGWVSRIEAARILERDPKTVTRMVERGDLEGRKGKRQVDVSLMSILAHMRKTQHKSIDYLKVKVAS